MDSELLTIANFQKQMHCEQTLACWHFSLPFPPTPTPPKRKKQKPHPPKQRYTAFQAKVEGSILRAYRCGPGHKFETLAWKKRREICGAITKNNTTRNGE